MIVIKTCISKQSLLIYILFIIFISCTSVNMKKQMIIIEEDSSISNSSDSDIIINDKFLNRNRRSNNYKDNRNKENQNISNINASIIKNTTLNIQNNNKQLIDKQIINNSNGKKDFSIKEKISTIFSSVLGTIITSVSSAVKNCNGISYKYCCMFKVSGIIGGAICFLGSCCYCLYKKEIICKKEKWPCKK